MKRLKKGIIFLSIALLIGFSNAKTNPVYGETITCYLISTAVCHTVIVHDPLFGPLNFPTYGVKAPKQNEE